MAGGTEPARSRACAFRSEGSTYSRPFKRRDNQPLQRARADVAVPVDHNVVKARPLNVGPLGGLTRKVRGPKQTGGIPLRKVVVLEFVTLDGVIQAPGGPQEDTDGGFNYGGWTVPYFN
jgi:hypothetical protein